MGLPVPRTGVSVQTSFCIESSGLTVGKALEDQPGQLCVPKVSPSRLHSLMACRISSRQLSVPMALVVSLTRIWVSLPTRNCCTPPMPAF